MSLAAPDEFSWEARVASGPQGAASVYVRSHRFEVGPPISFDRAEPRVTSLEYLIGALGADLVVGFRKTAWKRRLEVESVEATVRTTLQNPLAYLGVQGESGDAGVKTLEARLLVSTLGEPALVRQVWDETVAASPLCRTLRSIVQLDLTLKTLT